MLFNKERWFKDEEMGLLYARTSILEPSSIKWKKRIEFLGLDVDVLVTGTLEKLNATERKIMAYALNNIKLLEIQALHAIHDLCLKNKIESDVWEWYFKCSQIYIEKAELYISIKDRVNNLSYELELKWF